MTPPNFLNRDLVTGPYLVLCLSQAEFDALCDHLKIDRAAYMFRPEAGACVHYLGSGDDGSPICAVCLKDAGQGHTGLAVAGILVHEAVHVWQQHREFIGEVQPSREFEAYSIQTIAQRLMADFARRALGMTEVPDPAA